MKHSLSIIIALAIVVSASVLYLVRPESKAHAQLYRTLTIRSCRVDQALFRIRLTDRLGSTLVAGEIAGGSFGASVRAFVTGTTNLGRSTTVQGQTGSGYAGIGFLVELPIGMSFIDDIVVCLR